MTSHVDSGGTVFHDFLCDERNDNDILTALIKLFDVLRD